MSVNISIYTNNIVNVLIKLPTVIASQ